MKNNSVCQIKPDSIFLKTAPFKRSCRYHRKQGQTYKEDNLIPRNFCPQAYAKIYPQAFSILYGPDLKSEKILCPNKKFPVEFSLTSTYSLPSVVRRLKRFSLSFLNKIGVATEFPEKKISIEVKKTNKKCPKNFKTGDTFTFNIWRKNELCPASFYAMFPFYLKGSIPSFHCPDPDGISYQTSKGDFSCRQFLSGWKIKSNSLCPMLIYSLFPYFLTLKKGGKFEWVMPGENVQVQCPYRQGVIAEVFLPKESNKLLKVKIVNLKGACYLKIRKGQSFLLAREDFDKINSCL